MERLSASDEFESFRASWVTCMKESGYEGENPLSHWQAVLHDVQEGLYGHLENSPADIGAIEDYVGEAGRGPVVLDVDWIDGLVFNVPTLQGFFDDEWAQARADAQCREDGWQAIEAQISKLTEQVFGGEG